MSIISKTFTKSLFYVLIVYFAYGIAYSNSTDRILSVLLGVVWGFIFLMVWDLIEECLGESDMKTESQKPAEKEIKGIITDLKNKLESLSPAGKFFLIEIIKEIDKARADERKKVAEEIKRKYGVEKLLDDKFKARITGHIENIYYILEKLKEECEKIR